MDRSGFTLVEALIAVTLGALVIGLAVSIVVAQSGSFRSVSERLDLQSTVRSAAELLRDDLETVTLGGVVEAEEDRVVVRRPLVIGVVCGEAGPPTWYAYLPLGGDEAEQATGFGGGTAEGDWDYREGTWDDISGGTDGAAEACAQTGAETEEAEDAFHRLGLQPLNPGIGELVSLVTEVEYFFEGSDLREGALALYRREGDGEPIELATGFTEDAGFAYRVDDEFEDAVGPANVDDIVEIRTMLAAEGAGQAYDWTVRIPLGNVP